MDLRVVGRRWAVVLRIVEGFDQDLIRGAQQRLDRRVQMQHRDDRGRCGQAKLNVKLRTDEQKRTPMSRGCGRVVRASP